MKIWTNSVQDISRTNPNRETVRDADRKTKVTIKAFTRWMCTKKPPQNAKNIQTQNVLIKTLHPGRGRYLRQKHWKMFDTAARKGEKTDLHPPVTILVMLSKKSRRFGVHPAHLLLEELKIHHSWFQMYFRMLVGQFTTLLQMLPLYLIRHSCIYHEMLT